MAATVLRLPTLDAPPRPDEAGYLLVAGYGGDRFLYGDLWVDRPPLLLAVFRLAGSSGGVPALRALGLIAVAVLVLAAAHAGWTLGGLRGSRWAALTATALQATPLLGAPAVDGELLALPLVMSSIALGLAALDSRRTLSARGRALLLVVAGSLGASAALVKQNFVDALVLLCSLVVVAALLRQVSVRAATRQLVLLASGALLPAVLVVVWAEARSTGVAGLWSDLVAFRATSLDVIDSQSTTAPRARALVLMGLAALTGLVPVLALAAAVALRHRRSPVVLAAALSAVSAVASVSLGGSYWRHYLLQLVPVAVLAAAGLAVLPAGWSVAWRRASAVVVLVVPLSSVVSAALPRPSGPCDPAFRAATVSTWLRAHAQPGDTGLTLYGGANALYGSGVRPAYPYLWSLPVRVLDPDLAAVEGALTGPDAAAWVVQTVPLTSWGLDASGSVRAVLHDDYRVRAQVCGWDVQLRRDLAR